MTGLAPRLKIEKVPWLYFAMGLLLATSLVFMAYQNTSHAVGGHISLAKALWLDWTVTMFYLVPFFLWKNRAVGGPLRSLFGWLLLSFVLRGVAELVVIYATHDWRCLYGITHNAFTLGLAALLFIRIPIPDRRFAGFLLIYVATLFCESINAWQFSLLANPAAGIYFAADTPHFAFVNRLTWTELALLWPTFGWLLWTSRTGFSRT